MTNIQKYDYKYTYSAFGVNILSDIYFPELMPATGTGNVEIIYGKVPTDIAQPIIKGKTYQVAQRQLLFSVEGVGKYYVENGNKIVVQPDKNVNQQALRLFILGTAFGALLLQKGMLPIHGSSVVINGKCVIFTGASGAGKSTLASALSKKGYSILADDISVVILDSKGIPWVQPAYPQQKLCRDSAENIEIDTSLYQLIDPDHEKYAIPVNNHFLDAPSPLAAIYELKTADCINAGMEPLFGSEKLFVLIKNIYRVGLLEYIGLSSEFFAQCYGIAKQANFYRLIRPEGKFSLVDLVSKVEKIQKELFAV